MKLKAFILVSCDYDPQLIEEIKALWGVKRVDRVMGVYDLVVELNCITEDHIVHATEALKALHGVNQILRLVSIDNPLKAKIKFD